MYETRIFDSIATVEENGSFKIPVKDKNGKNRIAKIQAKFYPVRKRPSASKIHLKPITAFVICAIELNPPSDEDKLDWRLLTNLPGKTFKSALEKIRFYEMRWQIEIYHKVLKSGCRVEEIRLRKAERISRYLSVMTIVAWRIYWMSMVSRKAPGLPASAVLAEEERNELKLYCSGKKIPLLGKDANEYIRVVARLGGFPASCFALWTQYNTL